MKFVVVSAVVLLMVSGALLGVVGADSQAPVRYVVGFDDAPGVRAGDELHGARVLAVDDALRFASVVAGDERAFQERIAHDPRVRYAEPDPVMELLAYTPDDARYPTQYAPQLIGAPSAWDVTVGATSVAVCIVDSGVRSTHEDLAARWAGGFDFVNNDADAWDDNGHGTHVTGIAAAGIGNAKGTAGVANVAIKHAKALDASGSGAWSVVASAIRWCADQGAASIGLSLGGTSGSTALQDAVNYAWSKGVVLAAASGNGGSLDGVLYPARYVNTIAVGCVYATRGVCSFSNRGAELDLVAPGSGIDAPYWTNDTAYGKLSGTSMSTPHVAGAAALLKSAKPSATASEIRAALESSAEDLGAAGLDTTYGYGMLRLDRAMAALVAGAPAPGPAPAPEPAPVPTRGVDVSPAQQSATVPTGGSAVYSFVVQNTGSANDTIQLSVSGESGGWRLTLDRTSVPLAPGESVVVKLTAKAPKRAGQNVATLVATSASATSFTDTGVATTTASR